MVVHAYYPLGESRVEREALALIQRGYQVDVLCLRGRGEIAAEQIDGVQIYRLPVKRHRGSGKAAQFLEYLAFFVLAFLRLTWLYFQRNYQSVQVHNLPDFLVFSALVPKLSGARVILDLHDLMPEFYASSAQSGMRSKVVRILLLQEKLACRFANHVITVTELWRQTLIRRGVDPKKISVVMNVADNQVFRREFIPNTGTDQKQKKSFHLIYHGTITYRYGVDLLLHALKKVQDQIPEIFLTLHGTGECVEDIRSLAQLLDVEDHICFSTDFLPIADIPQMILQADLGVVPYRRNIFTDGILPTKLMEYVALGVPVLASETPIIRQYFDETMIQYFRAGDLEDLSKNILFLYYNRERLAQIAMNADQFNQEYDWNRIAASYTNTLDQLTNPSIQIPI